MNSNFEDAVRKNFKLDPLLSKEGCWNRSIEPDTPLVTFSEFRFSLAADALFIDIKNSIEEQARMIRESCDLEIDEIEELLLRLVMEKIKEFEKEGKRRDFDLRAYYSK